MPSPKVPPSRGTADLARLCADTRAQLRAAGHALHDDVGSSLSAAALQLQLLRMDRPDIAREVDHVLEALNAAAERVRELSVQLNPVPVRRGGLHNAFIGLAERLRDKGLNVELTYKADSKPPEGIEVAIYEAARAAIEEAVRDRASRLSVSIMDRPGFKVVIADNGRRANRTKALSATISLAKIAGLRFTVATKESTIVSIRYAIRRAARG